MKDKEVINNLSNLKILREKKKMTQLALAMELGVSQELISRYEVGSSFPQPNMLIKIANYFDCSIDYLLGISEISTPIKYLKNKDDIKNIDILNKYNSLKAEDKKYFEKFLNCLLDN